MTKIMVRVTQAHIDLGCHGMCVCPVALALIDAGFEKPFVRGNGEICFENPFYVREQPIIRIREVQNFVLAFDEDERSVQPFTFEMPI